MDYVKKHISRNVATIALVVCIVLAFMMFIQDSSERITRHNEEYLVELAGHRVVSVGNLNHNAYKFTPEGGAATVALSQDGRDGDAGRSMLKRASNG